MEVQIQELEVAGFKIVSHNSGGRPIAFVVEWSQGSGGPSIGFLPEYDALAGFGLAALAHCKLLSSGRTIRQIPCIPSFPAARATG